MRYGALIALYVTYRASPRQQSNGNSAVLVGRETTGRVLFAEHMDGRRNKYLVVLIYVALSLATFIAFEQVRNNKFVYDDAPYVTENRHITGGITRQSVLWALTSPHFHMWHPLTSLSHMLDCQLFGLNPSWHHLSSLLFHIASTLLLFGILKRMTGAIWLSGFVAAAFALHPLNVESVAWVAERKNVLSGLFWMLTIAAYIRYAERPGVSRFLLIVLGYGLSTMTKPMVVTLPFVLLLLDYWPLGRLQWASQSRRKDSSGSKSMKVRFKQSPAWRLLAEKIPLFTLSAVLSVITFVAQQRGGVVSGLENVPLKFRVANAFISYMTYIKKMIWPSRLAVFYPHPSDTLSMWQAAVAALLLLAVSAWVIWLARKRGYITVGWLWYLGTLVPVIGLVQVGSQAMADRYTYLPFIGLFIIIAWGGAELFGRWRHRKIGLGIFAGLLIVAMMVGTRMQVRHWEDRYSLYGHALEVTENNHVMHNNFGGVLLKRGQVEKAIWHIREALRINPDDAGARRHLAFALAGQGRLKEAISEYQKVLQIESDNYEALNGLGAAFAKDGRFDEAIKHFRQALQIKPDSVEAHINLGSALRAQGKFDEAISHFRQALQIKPDSVEAHINLGSVLGTQGKFDEAIIHFRQALQVRPNSAEVLNNLGSALAAQGRFDEAINYLRQALQIKPDYADARNNLSLALQLRSKPD